MHGLDGVYSVNIDKAQQKLTVVGDVDPAKIVRAIKKTRKIATICSHTDPAAPTPPPPEPAPPAADAAPPPPEPPTEQPEPPKDPPPPETPEPEVVKPSPEPEVHMVHHDPHNYVHKEHWNHEYPSVQAPVYVTHSYNSYQPSQTMSDYRYLRSPPRSTYYGGADHQAYNDGYYHNNRGGRDGNQVSSMFSDENPNACRIV